MSLGPVMVDIEGLSISDTERKRLQHPQVGGVILFSRNYQSPAQLQALTDDIHRLRTPRLVVAVDQEGGRVQRFREGFQILPAMANLGRLFDQNQKHALEHAQTFGWLMASELLHYGVDLSFSPVLDVGDPASSVIGDRGFHQHPDAITRLANAWIRGMRKAGMEAVGKHFPGHGSVKGDSHYMMPVDNRGFATIEANDLVPFRRVIATHLAGIMMAHVVYDQVDTLAAGYSSHWIEKVLRHQLGFSGIVFSDDLSMRGAESAGGFVERAQLSLQAGCDIILVCNNPSAADEILGNLSGYNNPTSQLRMVRLHGRPESHSKKLFSTEQWQQSVALLEVFNNQMYHSDDGDLFE